MTYLTVLTPVAAIELGVDVRPDDRFIAILGPDSGELEPAAHGFASIEDLQAFLAEQDPVSISIEGAKGEDVSSLRRSLLGPDSAPSVH